jgi:hypothetical protein
MADLIEKELKSFSKPEEVGLIICAMTDSTLLLFMSVSVSKLYCFWSFDEFYFFGNCFLLLCGVLGYDILQCSWSTSQLY